MGGCVEGNVLITSLRNFPTLGDWLTRSRNFLKTSCLWFGLIRVCMAMSCVCRHVQIYECKEEKRTSHSTPPIPPSSQPCLHVPTFMTLKSARAMSVRPVIQQSSGTRQITSSGAWEEKERDRIKGLVCTDRSEGTCLTLACNTGQLQL